MNNLPVIFQTIFYLKLIANHKWCMGYYETATRCYSPHCTSI